MICPFCGKEMEKGILSGDGRCKVRWKAGDKKADFWDALSGSGSPLSNTRCPLSQSLHSSVQPVRK